MKLISKSRFLDYLTCPKDAWFRMHHPEFEEFQVSSTLQNIFDQGYEAEEYAKQLKIFSGMVEVTTHGMDVKKEVDDLMTKKVPAIFQPTFIADGYIIRCDVIKWDANTGKWDLYEIKSSSSRHDTGARDHLSDAAFQAIVMEKYGVSLGKIFIVHLNIEYIRKGELDIETLFIQNDSTAKVTARKLTIVSEMEEAKKYLNQESEPKDGCDCIYCGRSSHCETFARSHPTVPEYSVHDLAYIGMSKNKLRRLIEQGIYHLHDIEDTSEFTDKQQNQIKTHKTNKEIVDITEISNILTGYAYPLYFFDYETFAPAVPIYDGFSPYKRMPIQFSLHYIESEGGPIPHKEYLHVENSDPSEAVAKLLCKYIEPTGTVLVWNIAFERSVTKELASRVPEYEQTLQRIARQMQDLMDIFSKQHYVHKGFRGRAAIESVMEVMLPEMSYDHLPYTGQDVGFVWWSGIVNKVENSAEREKKIKLIKDYCEQDTLVMVEIWKILKNLVEEK
jgi:CRISPR/Cas system-associated exonuclease Cas4 (RecB family)